MITNPGKMIRPSSSYHGFDLTSNNDIEQLNQPLVNSKKSSKNNRRLNSYGAPIRVSIINRINI